MDWSKRLALAASLVALPLQAAELRPMPDRDPQAQRQPEAPRSQPAGDAFYRDFATRARALNEAQRAELVTGLRGQAQQAEQERRYQDALHFYRLINAMSDTRRGR